MIAIPSRLLVVFVLDSAEVDERDVCRDMIALVGPDTTGGCALIANRGNRRESFETELNNAGTT